MNNSGQNKKQLAAAGAIDVHELLRLFDKGAARFVLDVRTPEEYSSERLSFADALIPIDSLERETVKLPLDKALPIYTFCRAGRRSALAANFLVSIGYENVYNVTGGIIAWKQAGYLTITGE